MLEPLSSQTVFFLWSVLFGAALGMLYDLMRALLLSFGNRRMVQNLCDILFFLLAGIMTSLFSLPFNRGNVRYFVILGEVIGFVLFLLTLGRVTRKLCRGVFGIIRYALRKICNLLKKIYLLLLKFMRFVVYNVNEIVDKRQHTQHQAVNKRGKHERKKRKDCKSEK